MVDLDDVPDGTSLLVQADPCTPRLATDDDLAPADLTLEAEPAAEAMSVELLEHERASASGQSAVGRIEVVDLGRPSTRIGA